MGATTEKAYVFKDPHEGEFVVSHKYRTHDDGRRITDFYLCGSREAAENLVCVLEKNVTPFPDNARVVGPVWINGEPFYRDDGWLRYPERKPQEGWCATTDGGDIRLCMWSKGRWVEPDRGILEFKQVTVNE